MSRVGGRRLSGDAFPRELVADCDPDPGGLPGSGPGGEAGPHPTGCACRRWRRFRADKLVGVVMNCVPRWFLWKTLGSHDYSYYRGDASSEEAPAG
jgi:hypothetical protein